MSPVRHDFLFRRCRDLLADSLDRWRQPNPVRVIRQRLREMFPEIAATSTLQRTAELVARRRGRTALARSIFADDIVAVAEQSNAETMSVLAQAVERDFELGRTVAIEGWILSQTEADLLVFIAR